MKRKLTEKIAAKALKKHKTLGGFATAALQGNTAALKDYYGSELVDGASESPRLSIIQKAAMSGSAGATGGYTVPQDLAQPILMAALDLNWFRKGAYVVPMQIAELLHPILNMSGIPHAGESAFGGGLTMTFTGESKTRTETEPAFMALVLKAWECGGYMKISNALARDSLALEAFLQRLVPFAIAYAELKAFLTGNGVGQPLGVINAPATIAVTRQTGNSVTFQDVAAMFSKLPPSSVEFASWAASPTAASKLLQLSDGANRAVSIQAHVANTPSHPRMTLMGVPLRIAEPLPALGTAGDLMLIDPYYYIIGDRGTLELAASESPSFLTNDSVLRVIKRLDGSPFIAAPITLQDGTTTVSPFIMLQ
jgi:HK97 family phage major capsid protein